MGGGGGGGEGGGGSGSGGPSSPAACLSYRGGALELVGGVRSARRATSFSWRQPRSIGRRTTSEPWSCTKRRQRSTRLSIWWREVGGGRRGVRVEMWGWGGVCGSGGGVGEVGGDENGDDGSGVEGGRRLGLKVDVFHQPLHGTRRGRWRVRVGGWREEATRGAPGEGGRVEEGRGWWREGGRVAEGGVGGRSEGGLNGEGHARRNGRRCQCRRSRSRRTGTPWK